MGNSARQLRNLNMNAHSPISSQAGLLSSRAMLAGLSIRQWTARRLDKRVTEEVRQAHGASLDAGRYNKALVAKDSLAAIVSAANAARTAHYDRTLPWLDDGARILPAAGYIAYTEQLRTVRGDFESAVEAFVSNYPVFVDDAKSRLNGLFNADDYPHASDIRNRFAFAVRILPMPDARDFRVQLADGQADQIRQEVETATREALDHAMRDAWQRIAETVGRMVDRLNAYRPAIGGNKAEGIFRDSLVDNVRELVALLPSFNLTADQALDSITRRMESELCQHGADDLRESDALRADTAKAAESIMADVAAYLA
jgi:hypothetical protein